jgi:hypothetical protein
MLGSSGDIFLMLQCMMPGNQCDKVIILERYVDFSASSSTGDTENMNLFCLKCPRPIWVTPWVSFRSLLGNVLSRAKNNIRLNIKASSIFGHLGDPSKCISASVLDKVSAEDISFADIEVLLPTIIEKPS